MVELSGTQRPRTQKRRQTPLSGHLQFQLLYVSELPVTPWKGYTEARTFDLKDVYLNNPSDKAISEKNPLILGMSCALWTDDGVTERMIDRRLFPRILALSEQMWHEGEALDFDRFYRNILHRKAWFEEAGFEFGPALKEDVTKDYKWD